MMRDAIPFKAQLPTMKNATGDTKTEAGDTVAIPNTKTARHPPRAISAASGKDRNDILTYFHHIR
jgi:hypothetical protein